jgi:hypothetical protein
MNRDISCIPALGAGSLPGPLRISAAESGPAQSAIGHHELARRIPQDERMDEVLRRERNSCRRG